MFTPSPTHPLPPPPNSLLVYGSVAFTISHVSVSVVVVMIVELMAVMVEMKSVAGLYSHHLHRLTLG